MRRHQRHPYAATAALSERLQFIEINQISQSFSRVHEKYELPIASQFDFGSDWWIETSTNIRTTPYYLKSHDDKSQKSQNRRAAKGVYKKKIMQ